MRSSFASWKIYFRSEDVGYCWSVSERSCNCPQSYHEGQTEVEADSHPQEEEGGSQVLREQQENMEDIQEHCTQASKYCS